MSKRKPSAESVKAHREWSNLIDDLTAINRMIDSQQFVHGNAPSESQVAQKAKIEARLKELDLSAGLDFPL